MADALTDDQRDQIREEVHAGQKIAAIKLYKNWTGSSLVEAKNAVEKLVAGQDAAADDLAAGIPGDQMDAILDDIQRGKKLNAVKCYRTASGASLAESKEFIERLMKELEIEDPGSVPGGSGCGGVVLMMIVFGTGLIIASRC